MEDLIGRAFGKYRIIARLGHGGMAEVYKAYQANLERHVALKLLHPHLAAEPGFVERFEREAKNIAALRHPNIVQVYDFDIEDQIPYIVMELIDGPTLDTHLADCTRRGELLSLAEQLRLIRDVGQALAVVTGLASGGTPPESGWVVVIWASLTAYTAALGALGAGGVLLVRDLFRPAGGGATAA
jgi:serine/threonine protein kinase